MCYVNYVLHIHTQNTAQNSNKPNNANANLIPIHTLLSVQLEIAVRLSLPDQAWTTNVLHTSAQYDHKIFINRTRI